MFDAQNSAGYAASGVADLHQQATAVFVAQNAAGYSASGRVFLVAIVIAAAVFALAVLVLVLLLRHLRANREMTHRERLQALETGKPLDTASPSDPHARYMHNAFWIAFWMVLAVPGGAFSAAAAASERVGQQLGVLLAIWIAACAVSVASVICATVLMIHSRSGRSGAVGGEESKSLPKWADP